MLESRVDIPDEYKDVLTRHPTSKVRNGGPDCVGGLPVGVSSFGVTVGVSSFGGITVGVSSVTDKAGYSVSSINTGVSTSINPLSNKNTRMEFQKIDRLRIMSFTSGLNKISK